MTVFHAVMSTITNPYALNNLDLTLVKDAAMKESPTKSNSSGSSFECVLSGRAQDNLPDDPTTNILDGMCNEDTIKFGLGESFCISPSFRWPINKETLQTNI